MAEDVLLTKEGYEKIKAEHEELITKTRSEVAQRLKEVGAFGDLSENAEYDAAKNEQAEVEVRINKLEDMMRHAKIIDEDQTSGKVNLGSKVKIKKQLETMTAASVFLSSMGQVRTWTGVVPRAHGDSRTAEIGRAHV